MFIVFEGIDCSGTSTQSKLLATKLNSKRLYSKLTAEPNNSDIGLFIRQILSKKIDLNLNKEDTDRVLSYLFAADRLHHLKNTTDNSIDNILKQGYVVVCTRYYYSSLAYHCSTEEDANFVIDLNKNFRRPDLVIYLDCDLQTSLERLSKRKNLDIYENQIKLMEVKRNYDEIFEMERHLTNVLILNATDSIDNIHNDICSYIDNNFDLDKKLL